MYYVHFYILNLGAIWTKDVQKYDHFIILLIY
jgi:hypothetical protein